MSSFCESSPFILELGHHYQLCQASIIFLVPCVASYSGGVRPPSPPRHNTTAPEEPVARADLSAYLCFLIMKFLTRTCLSGSSLISLFLLGFRVGSSLFGISFVRPFLFVDFYFSMSIFRCWVVGLKWALSPLGPLWAL